MSWEDIILLEVRMRFEKEDEDRCMAVLAEQSCEREHTHAPVSYEGMDTDQPAPAPSKKPKTAGPVRKTASQKALELKVREICVLVKGLQH
ncbi:hypothetical protein DFH11DRAFT_1600618 [Phellopilus nigrolimitatus]|nr:hypothetical protein DFH11DRAFT_1600618 [Phellopilus nigrolimitatus]